MGRISRRRSARTPWVGALGDPFTFQELLDLVDATTVPQALAWLYAAIEHGRVVPLQGSTGIRYRFVGDRRQDDRPRTPRARRTPPAPGG